MYMFPRRHLQHCTHATQHGTLGRKCSCVKFQDGLSDPTFLDNHCEQRRLPDETEVCPHPNKNVISNFAIQLWERDCCIVRQATRGHPGQVLRLHVVVGCDHTFILLTRCWSVPQALANEEFFRRMYSPERNRIRTNTAEFQFLRKEDGSIPKTTPPHPAFSLSAAAHVTVTS